MSTKYTIVIQEDDGGYSGHCLEIPWARGQGDTKEEAIDDIKKAVKLCKEVLDEEKDDEMKQVVSVMI